MSSKKKSKARNEALAKALKLAKVPFKDDDELERTVSAIVRVLDREGYYLASQKETAYHRAKNARPWRPPNLPSDWL